MNISHDSFKKYIKYRMKYLELIMDKKNQFGGATVMTISNNGQVPQTNMTNQCLWISIRDYLAYALGINITVFDLKREAGLPKSKSTDNIPFDDTNPILLEAANRLCEQYNLTLNFIVTARDGTIRPISLDSRGHMIPTGIINRGALNQVYIASFGNHFELITTGPGYSLKKHATYVASIPAIYTPKILEKKDALETYITFADNKNPLNEIQLAIIDTVADLKIYRKELQISNQEIEESDIAIKELQNSTLSLEEKQQIELHYVTNKSFSDKIRGSLCARISELSKQLEELKKKLVEFNINTPPDIPAEDFSKGSCAVSNKYYFK